MIQPDLLKQFTRSGFFSRKTLAHATFLCYTKSMKYDYKALYEKNAAFYNAHPLAKRALKLGDIFLTGLFFIAYGLLCAHTLFIEEYNPSLFVKILFPPLLALLAVTILRKMVERPRPFHEDGANITPVLEKKKESKCSFPSRHLACAGVIALTVCSFFPVAGIFLLGASFLLGYIRFASGFHYPSDLFFGEALGVAIGALAFFL